MTPVTVPKKVQPRAGWRFRLGLTVLIVGWLSPLLIPVITRSSLGTEWKTIISGLLAVGIPEVFSVAAIAIMGKDGYDLIKDRIFNFLKKHGPPDRVTPARYRIGLVMFLFPLIFGWLAPYGAHLIPGYQTNRLVVNLAGDAIFVASLFVLGGDFWDKLKALFLHRAKAHISAET